MSVEAREEINEEGSVQDLVMLMSEGNPGALSVQMQLLELNFDQGLSAIMTLDDMNMRGGQIWCAFKYCQENFMTLLLKLADHAEDLVDHVNEGGRHFKEWSHLSVTSGAKGNRQFL